MRSREKFVLLLRHGIAEDKGKTSDFDRALTAAGHEKMKRIARTLPEMFPDADTIYSGPLLRAVETAEHVAEAYSKVEVTQTDALRPEAKAAAFRDLLAATGGDNIICVGHEPNLSTIMLAVTGLSDSGRVTLKKGGFYGVRFDSDGDGKLEWLVPPRVLLRGE